MARQGPECLNGFRPEKYGNKKCSQGCKCSQGLVNDSDAKRARGGDFGEHKVPGGRNEVLQEKLSQESIKSLMISQMHERSVPVKEGIMTLLQDCLEADSLGVDPTVALSGYVEHFESRHKEDLGWGCGWRNIQMLCSHMLSQDAEAREALFGGAGFVPDIPAVQRWLEIAWAKGFDIPGAKYFDCKISGTHKWIGTTECAALLRSFGVRAKIVDFQTVGGKRDRNGVRSNCGCNSPSEAKGGDDLEQSSEQNIGGDDSQEGECVFCGNYPSSLLRRSTVDYADTCPTCMGEEEDDPPQESEANAGDWSSSRSQITGMQRGVWNDKAGSGGGLDDDVTINHKHMVNWVWNYFLDGAHKESPSQPLMLSNRSPLYFQHRGHSRTIVGIERRRKGDPSKGETINLIVLDPSQGTDDIVRALRERNGWERFVKRGTHTLKQPTYQLCYIEPGIAKGEELEGLKILTSVHYTY